MGVSNSVQVSHVFKSIIPDSLVVKLLQKIQIESDLTDL
jgi:hypothetical protein